MTAQKALEIEAKLLVQDLDAVRRRLEALGAELEAPRVHEWNIRYQDILATFTRRQIVLRLREDSRVRLTYKAPADEMHAGLKTVRELEVEVSDFETMDAILQGVGFLAAVRYEKYRTTYVLNGCEVVLDEMPYGSFIEIEGHPGAIEETIAALKLEDAPRFSVSYLVLFDWVKFRLGLTFNDLTFENFAGIDVPPDAFSRAVM